jgi:hypothetical protein
MINIFMRKEPYNLVEVERRFRGANCLYHQSDIIDLGEEDSEKDVFQSDFVHKFHMD